jgi:2-oxoisovalerate dehydrogenase E1 component alpha subunit
MRTCYFINKKIFPKRLSSFNLKYFSSKTKKVENTVEVESAHDAVCYFKYPLTFYSQIYTSDLAFKSAYEEKIKSFRVLEKNGEILNPKYENIDKETALKIFNTMIAIKECDTRFNMAQRQGLISFYMTCIGEEAVPTASSAALSDDDMIFPQYREAACLLYRGFSIQEMAHQLCGNEYDYGKGRQMPVHYGSKKLNYQTVSSPLCTQVPQASGAGYHFRVKDMKKIAVTYFGEGAASEGDFHPALNFASTLKSQTLFVCRNNIFAISTPADDQYHGDGVAARGPAYGINTIRVDGNDVFAVYNAVKASRELILKYKVPVLMECMTYRGGDHSTSDNSRIYRGADQMCKWEDYLMNLGDPIERFYLYLTKKQWIKETEFKGMVNEINETIKDSLKNATKAKKPSIDSIFEDVYEKIPLHLQEQKMKLKEHINKYPEIYDVNNYKEESK